jgi:hypothetical protein
MEIYQKWPRICTDMVIIIKTKVLLPQAYVALDDFGYPV